MPQCIYVPPGRNIINLIVFLLPHYLRTIRPKMCLAAGVFSSQVLVPSTQVWSSSCEVWEVKFSLVGQKTQDVGCLQVFHHTAHRCRQRVGRALLIIINTAKFGPVSVDVAGSTFLQLNHEMWRTEAFIETCHIVGGLEVEVESSTNQWICPAASSVTILICSQAVV